MGKASKPGRVKLIAGILYSDPGLYLKARVSLERIFGRADFESPEIGFNHTDYYEHEMGRGLIRRFLGFEKLISLEKIFRVKLLTNRIELSLSRDRKRRVNIDPGYMDLGKLVLFSTKDHSHRIYLQDGIYAESTLYYKDKSFRAWPWTYPDYKTEEYLKAFDSIRSIYKDNRLNLRG